MGDIPERNRPGRVSREGRLDSGLFVRVVSYGALPLMTVLASQFPVVGNLLSHWLQPALDALH